MVSETGKELSLLRQRDRAKRSMQLWVALAGIWFVIGWAPWGLVGGLTGSPAAGWAVYLVPLVVLGVMALLKVAKVRSINQAIVDASRG